MFGLGRKREDDDSLFAHIMRRASQGRHPETDHLHHETVVAVDYASMTSQAGEQRFTHAVIRCGNCGHVKVETFPGTFTIAQLNGVSVAEAALALERSSRGVQNV